jgi:hypothetical protein
VVLFDGGELESYQEVMLHDQKNQWLEAMQDEMNLCMRITYMIWWNYLKARGHSRINGYSNARLNQTNHNKGTRRD